MPGWGDWACTVTGKGFVSLQKPLDGCSFWSSRIIHITPRDSESSRADECQGFLRSRSLIVEVVVCSDPPANASVARDRAAAPSLPAPQASVTITGR
jgi:hypothetical protein